MAMQLANNPVDIERDFGPLLANLNPIMGGMARTLLSMASPEELAQLRDALGDVAAALADGNAEGVDAVIDRFPGAREQMGVYLPMILGAMNGGK